MNFKQQYKRFKAWQLNAFDWSFDGPEHHRCVNCENDFVGNYCPYCGEVPCARIEGGPCRHPDKVRPSLEAIGFDIGKTAKDLLGLEIKWSRGGFIPEYLTLVCGIFYQKSA